MAIWIRGVSQHHQMDAGVSHSVVLAVSAVVQNGDKLIVFLSTAEDEAVTAPGGWTQITVSSGTPSLRVYTKTWSTGDAMSYTWSAIIRDSHGVMLTLGGAAFFNVLDSAAVDIGVSAATESGTVGANDLMLFCAMCQDVLDGGDLLWIGLENYAYFSVTSGQSDVVAYDLINYSDSASFFVANPPRANAEAGWPSPFVVSAAWVPAGASGSKSFTATAVGAPTGTIDMGSVLIGVEAGAEPSTPAIPAITKRMGWQLLLANSSDMSVIGELARARDKQLTLTLNRPGSLSFSYKGTDSLATSIQPMTTCVIAKRDGIIRWSGPVWSIDESVPGDDMKVQCVGWQELLNHRLIHEDFESLLNFVNADAGIIAMTLLDAARGDYPSNTVIANGGAQISQPRTRAYKRKQNIGQEIQALSDIEAGYDIDITPDTRLLTVYNALGTNRITTVHFSYKVGTDHNLRSVQRQISSDKMVNSMFVSGDLSTILQENIASLSAGYPAMQEHNVLAGVKSDDSTNALLSAYAAAEFAVRSDPLVIYSIAPMPWDNANPKRVPRIFEDYVVGDTVKFSARQGRINVSAQAVRIFSASIMIDNNGNETVSALQTSY